MLRASHAHRFSAAEFNAALSWIPRIPYPTMLWASHARRYPAAEFNAARAELDPKNILSNDIVDALFPRHDLPPPAGGSASPGSDLLPEEAVAATS